jgi:hypothetical protein
MSAKLPGRKLSIRTLARIACRDRRPIQRRRRFPRARIDARYRIHGQIETAVLPPSPSQELIAALCCRLSARCEVPSIGRRLGGPTKRRLVHGFGLQGPQNRWRGWLRPVSMLIRRTGDLRFSSTSSVHRPATKVGALTNLALPCSIAAASRSGAAEQALRIRCLSARARRCDAAPPRAGEGERTQRAAGLARPRGEI